MNYVNSHGLHGLPFYCYRGFDTGGISNVYLGIKYTRNRKPTFQVVPFCSHLDAIFEHKHFVINYNTETLFFVMSFKSVAAGELLPIFLIPRFSLCGDETNDPASVFLSVSYKSLFQMPFHTQFLLYFHLYEQIEPRIAHASSMRFWLFMFCNCNT